jgi:hypothetical protein
LFKGSLSKKQNEVSIAKRKGKRKRMLTNETSDDRGEKPFAQSEKGGRAAIMPMGSRKTEIPHEKPRKSSRFYEKGRTIIPPVSSSSANQQALSEFLAGFARRRTDSKASG